MIFYFMRFPLQGREREGVQVGYLCDHFKRPCNYIWMQIKSQNAMQIQNWNLWNFFNLYITHYNRIDLNWKAVFDTVHCPSSFAQSQLLVSTSRRTAEGREEVRDPRCVGNKVFFVDNDSFGARRLVDHFIRILLLLGSLFFLLCVRKEK